MKWSELRSHIRRIFPHPQMMIIILVAGLLASYQNCGDKVQFSQSLKAPSVALSDPNGLLRINGGIAPFTNDQMVRLSIEYNADAKYLVLANDDCSDPTTATWISSIEGTDWLLNDKDGAAVVTLNLKGADEVVSDCIKATITLDRKAPALEFLATPPKLANNKAATFDLKVSDETSGIDKIFCRSENDAEYKECKDRVPLDDLKDGPHNLTVMVSDKAGNRSEPLQYSWLVDLTIPTVSIVAPLPPALSTINSVSVYFEGSDGAMGSGIAGYRCFLNNTEIANCTSPAILQNLADGDYTFRVQSVDNVGLMSLPAEAKFKVDTQPSEAFQILGVTGGQDIKVDAFLSEPGFARVHWTPSLGAQSYRASIWNEAGTTQLCAVNDILANAVFADFTGCVLNDNTKYQARVSAFRNGLERRANDFLFTVDVTGPVITIISINKQDDLKKARIDFSITDAGSGVESAVCYKKYKADIQQNNCFMQTFIEYTNLPQGEHEFSITAFDRLGHLTASLPVKFNMEYVVCDPFNLVEGRCQKGLKARLYYASAADRALGNSALNTKYNQVAKLITGGLKSNAIIYFGLLDVRTRQFTEGFSTTDNSLLRDDQNNVLNEWFALDLESVIKLGPNDTAGLYQFMLISDDGSVLSVDPAANNQFRVLVNNDGTHATRVGCSAVGDVLNLSANSRIPIKIQYYQGPKTQLGVSLFWRKVTAANAAHSAYCGRSDGPNGYGFGLPQNYQSILDEGFKPLSADNYILPEEVRP